MEVSRYEHHGADVAVITELKGQHREHCLCWACGNFKPEDREGNCEIANQLFGLCVKYNLVTPVYECAAFKER